MGMTLFVASAMGTVFMVATLLGIIAGSPISWPRFYAVTPDAWWIMFPSLAYQIYFWTIKLGIL